MSKDQPISRLSVEDCSETNAEFIDFYVQRASESGGPVLDVGCGAGYITVALARAGIEITACDDNPEAIEVANERVALAGDVDVTLYEVDVTEWDIPQDNFQTVLLANNVLGEIIELEERAQLLNTLHGHMADGGRVFLDVPMIREDAIIPQLGMVRHDYLDDDRIEQSWDSAWDPVNRTLEGAIRLEDEHGTRVLGQQTHVFTLQEIVLQMLLAGFDVDQIWGTVDGEDLAHMHTHAYIMATRDGGVE